MSASLLRLDMPEALSGHEELQIGNTQRRQSGSGVVWSLVLPAIASNEVGTWTIPAQVPAQLYPTGGPVLDLAHHAYYIFTLDHSGTLYAVAQENLQTVMAALHVNLVAWVDLHHDLTPYRLPGRLPGILDGPPYFGAPIWRWWNTPNGKLTRLWFHDQPAFGIGFWASSEDGTIVQVTGGYVDIPGAVPGTFDVWTDRDGNMSTTPAFIKLFTVTIVPRVWGSPTLVREPDGDLPDGWQTPAGLHPILGGSARLPSPVGFDASEYQTDIPVWYNQVGFGWRGFVLNYPGPRQGVPGATGGAGLYIQVSGQTGNTPDEIAGSIPMETAHLPPLPLNDDWADPLVNFWFRANTGYYLPDPAGPFPIPVSGPQFIAVWSTGDGGFGNQVFAVDHFNSVPPGVAIAQAGGHLTEHDVAGPQKYVSQLVCEYDPLFNFGTAHPRAGTQWTIAPGIEIHMYVSGPA